MTEDPKEREARASKALKQGRATEAAQAMSEYIAERNAERAKTAYADFGPTGQPTRNERAGQPLVVSTFARTDAEQLSA